MNVYVVAFTTSTVLFAAAAVLCIRILLNILFNNSTFITNYKLSGLFSLNKGKKS